jgi:peptidoglycan hydrolase-like protein with peptidoglycan-binding domain
MLAAARQSLGLAGRPNYVTRDYAARHGGAFLNAPWCDMAVTHWARKSGNADAVLPEGDRAYTVWHAQDGRNRGLWFAGTATNLRKHAQPGALVFFDWGGTDTISKIDHVGVVEKVLPDGRIQTIEANTGDVCARRVRAANVVAGFWNPPYTAAPSPPARPAAVDASWTETLVKNLPLLKQGSDNYSVKTLRAALFARGGLDEASHGGAAGLREWLENTRFDAALTADVKAFQKAKGLVVDGEVGQQTWPRLILP